MTTKNGIEESKIMSDKKSFEEEVEFEMQMLALTFLSEIEKECEKQNILRKDLAKKIGTSASYLTQIFRSNKTPNLRILTALGLAVGKKFNVIAVNNIEKVRQKS